MPYKNREDRLAHQRRYYQEHKERYQDTYNNHYRQKRVFLKSRKNVLVPNKPAYPESGECALCGVKHRLYYHHWTDEHPEWGMWICNLCHTLAEKVEQNLDLKYRELKKQIRG